MSSTINLEKAVGVELDVEPVAWNTRDLLLYAVGIGAKKDDLAMVYELDKHFAPFPTYPVVLPLKGESQELNVFRERVHERRVAGLPRFDPNRGVHGSQSIEILKPLPTVSGAGWKMRRRIVESGIIIETESVLEDASGVVYAKLFSGSFNVGAKATGQRFSKAIAAPPAAKPPPKDRKPDWVFTDKTSPEQAILYRLSGDYNPLHIDPTIGKAANFGGVILHGLSTFGFVARGILTEVGGGDPNGLRYFGVRFTSPVRPGDALETSVWEIGPVGGGFTEVAFVTKDVTSGKICLGNGVAYIKKIEKSKL
ncbi:peroxisomal dehydratase [Schizopora paradoxa]|uniref:Peroxisomal dehydratase n=1 Tax=Schizopora paradoxa TaxID=27342 RepID=A0A0H2S3P1_9AGAM|nr:peroxisomal dehydratase [Schizopora paradoxa]